MTDYLKTLILAAAIVLAGYIGGSMAAPRYAVTNADTQSVAAFYEVDTRSGQVRRCTTADGKWHCSNVFGNI